MEFSIKGQQDSGGTNQTTKIERGTSQQPETIQKFVDKRLILTIVRIGEIEGRNLPITSDTRRRNNK